MSQTPEYGSYFTDVVRRVDRALTGKVKDDAEGTAHKLKRVGQAWQPADTASTAWTSDTFRSAQHGWPSADRVS